MTLQMSYKEERRFTRSVLGGEEIENASPAPVSNTKTKVMVTPFTNYLVGATLLLFGSSPAATAPATAAAASASTPTKVGGGVKRSLRSVADAEIPAAPASSTIATVGGERKRKPLSTQRIPFAGGKGTHSVLSVLAGAHSIGEGFLGFLTMEESNALRCVCKEFREAVMDFPWMDFVTYLGGDLKVWREAFPAARAVNVSDRRDLVDSDFVHIRGDARARLHTVNMMSCSGVTDAAFVHLRGIHTLNMSRCNQATIMDAAFVHLRGIQSLNMFCCNQATITDAAFVHLRGIQVLDMAYCRQITDAAFVHLRGIKTLNMWGCKQATITDAAFVHLRGIQDLNMPYCNHVTITDAALEHLGGIQTLNMHGCRLFSDAALVHLRGIRFLMADQRNHHSLARLEIYYSTQIK